MKKLFILLSIISIIGISGCSSNNSYDEELDDKDEETEKDPMWADEKTIEYTFNEMYGNELVDNKNKFSSTSDIDKARILVNGEYDSEFYKTGSSRDVQMEFYNKTSVRIVNASGGMAYTIPYEEDMTYDYSIAKYRTQIHYSDSILSASAEYSNPYGNTIQSWNIYRDEWLLEFINSDKFLTDNNINVIEKTYEDYEFKDGYEVYFYSLEIKDKGNIDMPFYTIGLVKEKNEYIQFGLFVMKSHIDKTDVMKDIIDSYTKLKRSGTAKNYYDAGAPEADPMWNDATKNYYEMLNKQETTQWGSFNRSMPGGVNEVNPGNSVYEKEYATSIDLKNKVEEIWDHHMEIYPTYTHLEYYNNKHYFPLAMANELAGGNGFNNKPVLQFTYQFTSNNNLVNASNPNGTMTPMFDILRGKYDEHLIKLAQDMKAYKEPILFRLNNEMNTDWTSYCGMVTLLDPDIFNMTWRYLYDIFEEQGVDNAIWIWNAVADSIPYSSWGEDLCYNPGEKYVHLLGLTSYEMLNNADNYGTFEEKYTELESKNDKAWSQYAAIISEFACGSGGATTGELGRNADIQAQWVEDMFKCLNDPNRLTYIKRIIGIVWFNTNDYEYVDGDYIISNRLRFVDSLLDPWDEDYSDLAKTHAAFKEGFKNKLN